MIDTDKYTDYSSDRWIVTTNKKLSALVIKNGLNIVVAEKVKDLETARLMRDSPKLLTEVKRLREAIADIANNMEAADDSYMSGFIEDLRKVIE